MSAPRSAIPVLRFHAGPLRLGIAAEDVEGVRSAAGDVIHIATIFGVEPTVGPLGRRVIQVAASTLAPPRPLVFEADAPVDVVRCGVEDVMRTAPGIPLDHWKPVMGFALIDGDQLLLLDIPSLAEKLLQRQERG